MRSSPNALFSNNIAIEYDASSEKSSLSLSPEKKRDDESS